MNVNVQEAFFGLNFEKLRLLSLEFWLVPIWYIKRTKDSNNKKILLYLLKLVTEKIFFSIQRLLVLIFAFWTETGSFVVVSFFIFVYKL